MRRTGWTAWLIVTLLWGGGVAADEFETPVPEPAAQLLPAALLESPDCTVVDPVVSDGLMHRFIVDSRFGRFAAYGPEGLAMRLHEIAALSALERQSELGVVVDAVGDRLSGSARSVVTLASHPVDTVTGIPRGISRLFQGYVAQAREVTAATAHAERGAGGASPDVAASDAARYVARYFGLTDHDRAWYRKLAVDPYTDNEVLRRAVHRLARVDATASFGLQFAPIPGIPYAGELQRTMDAIYSEDPAVLRARRRARLVGYGLTTAELQAYENTLTMTPTRQQWLDAAAMRLEGVDGRDQLFRHAIGLTSDAEAAVYVRSAVRLAALNGGAPLATILAGPRMPSARTVQGGIVVVAAFDAVRWTADVAGDEAATRAALPDDAPLRELWLAAPPSPRAAAELEARGWRLCVDTTAETSAPLP